MSISTLRRIAPAATEGIGPPLEQLPAREKTLLALQEMGISPFVPETVEEYKKDMIRDDTPWLRRCFTPNQLRGLWWAYAPTFDDSGVLGYAFLAEAGIALTGLVLWCFHFNMVAGAFMFCGGIAFLICAFLCSAVTKASTWASATWTSTEIDSYDDIIPTFVVNDVGAIGRRLPKAEFEVCYFTAGFDPFLVVRTTDENGKVYRDHVHVWAEPRYEAERLI